MNDEKKIIYDAEQDSVNMNDEIHLEPEPNQTDKKIVYDAENPDPLNTDVINPDHQNAEDEYEINEDQKTVFKDGLEGGQFIRLHNCPMCMVGKKSISELYMKKRFRKKKVVGYASICANCGFTSFYTTNINDLLSLFKGKVTK